MTSIVGKRARDRWLSLAVTLLLAWLLPDGAAATVYLSQEEALALAFPDAEHIEPRSFVLTEEQQDALERSVGGELDSKILTLHVGMRNGRPTGYALIDVHTVRTQPEALMVVLDTQGVVVSVRVLAFYEPSEYLPSDRFREQFAGETLDPDLRIGGRIDGVAGATLSSRSTARCVRLALAAFERLVTAADRAPGGAPRQERGGSPGSESNVSEE